MVDRQGILRVGIDATPMLVAKRTGMENYAFALIRELAALQETTTDIRLSIYLHAGNPFASRAHLQEAVDLLRRANVPFRVHGPRRGYGGVLSAYAAIDRLHLLHLLKRGHPWIKSCPYVLTIYDVMFVGLPEEGRQIERAMLSAYETNAIEEAAGLIAISESTTRDLATAFGASLKMPIRAIHLGVDAVYFTGQEQAEAMRRKYGWERYIFFIGTLQYRKNLPRLIAAFAQVKRSHRIPHKLVLAGRDGWGAELVYAAVKEQDIESEVVFPGYVPDDDLPGLYAGADVFAYPSLHEGFGIPLLEAMASGTPVLTAPLFSMPEVAGDAALYVDPYSVDAIAVGLWQIISDEGLRRQLGADGRNVAQRFSWAQMALDTLQFYREVARV